LVGFGFRKTRCNRTRSATEEVRERERERAMAARKGLFGLASARAGEAAINWYPGHMASATKAIRERIKLVDLVLEVRDARKWVKHFEACKQHHVFVNAHQQKAVKKMLDMARELLRERLAKEPTLLLMILGIPNVGKSALVNSLFHLSHSSTSGAPEESKGWASTRCHSRSLWI